eukprot:TRINITY_DN15154_c0_g2_i1.p1 TRINITY_DN15154_c0_g2~~TRINITY_DN15154_c0_g2_i1.p1  ORF type:complete len:280 (+),score=42.78 TRINITY_DN15154_c0_g2_i1:142-981(+)
MLLPQIVLFGYDVVAHIAEETKRSDVIGPPMMLLSYISVAFFGWIAIVGMCFSIQRPENLLYASTVTGGNYPFFQILWDVFESRCGSGMAAEVLMLVPFLSSFFQLVVLLTSSSRVAFSISRDSGLPFSKLWMCINQHTVPSNAVLLATLVAFLAVLPVLQSTALLNGFLNLGFVAWMGSYILPISLRFFQSERDFLPGPFYLPNFVGKLGGKAVHFISMLWLIYSCVALMLPETYPITWQNFNYALISMGIALCILLSWWFLDAQNWFVGPVSKTDPE